MKRIASTLIAAIAVVVALGTSGAQPNPAPPVTPVQPDVGSAGSAAPTGSAGSASMPAAGSAEAGSAEAAGSAAAGSAGSAGSGSGSAAPPKFEEVDCAKNPPEQTVKIVNGKYDITPPNQPLTTGHTVQFQMPPGGTDDAESYPNKDPNNKDTSVLHANPGTSICVRYNQDGEYKFHSAAHPIEGTIYARAWYDILAEKPVGDPDGGGFFLPDAVNQEADDSDMMFMAVLGLSAFFFIGIAGAVVYLTVKYRHRPGHAPQPSPAHNDALEVTWTIIPTIICVFLFYYGWHSYVRVVTPPNKAVEIQVQAKKWSWNFVHENGVSDADLHIPANTPVRFVMTSQDVLHSFYIPVMRVKQDIVPRRYTYAWVYAKKAGTFRLTCAEYCGTDHSQMGRILQPVMPDLPDGRRRVVVVHESLQEYEKYLEDKNVFTGTPEELGAKMYVDKGCIACHSVDGSARIGPTWKQPDWGKEIAIVGGTVKMDENYVRESILAPQAKSRPDFTKASPMPVFEGQLKESEIRGLIAYIKSLKQP